MRRTCQRTLWTLAIILVPLGAGCGDSDSAKAPPSSKATMSTGTTEATGGGEIWDGIGSGYHDDGSST